MASLQKAWRKVGGKNILVTTVCIVLIACLHAWKKGSIAAAIKPALTGLVLILGGELYLARKS